MELAGKKVVITGAGRGLGRAMAISLAKQGAQLFLSARNENALNETSKMIEASSGLSPMSMYMDLSNTETIAAFAEAVANRSESIDILINNGASWLSGTLDQVSDLEIVETINSAAVGTAVTTRHFLPLLRKSSAADIVNLVSVCGLPNTPHETANEAFHAAKFAQSGFSERLRQRLKPEGIRVLAVYPPNIDDVSPNESEWEEVRDTRMGQHLSNRHVVETIMFALTRDRICSLHTIHMDSWPAAHPPTLSI